MEMSRRKPPQRAGLGGTTIRVVCTDKGQHAEVGFGSADAWQDSSGWHVSLHGLDYRGDEYVDLEPIHRDQIPDRLHKTYPLECRRCGRDVPLRAETLERIIADFAAANMPVFDLSHMS